MGRRNLVACPNGAHALWLRYVMVLRGSGPHTAVMTSLFSTEEDHKAKVATG